MDKQKARDLDDLTLALMIEDHFGSESLRKHPSGVWFFDGKIWRLMKEQTLKAIATDVLAQQIDQVRDARVKAAISLFKSRHFDEDERFERGDHNVIVLKDGYYLFDGESWLRMAPDRDLMRRIQIPASYVDDQPSAFNKFIDDILCDADGNTRPDARNLRQLIWEMLGYCLVTHAKYEQCFILCGAGANGKSVLGAVAKEMVGRNHTASVQPNQMGSVFQRSNLEGKLLNLVTELNQNAELEDGMLKAVISGEMMSVEKKHQDVREIEPFAKHMILTNHMPRIRDYSDGLFRRVSIVPLVRQFMGSDADPHLLDKLRGELDAITSRAIDALGQLIIRNGEFTRPSSSVAALEEWRLENNHLADFVAERLCIDPRASLGVQVAYDAYVGWFTSTGLRGMLGRKQFSKRLAALLRMPNKRTAEGYTFQGVAPTMIQKHALNVLCEGSPENYNKDGERSESFNNFPGTYRKYTKYIEYVPWPTPCEVGVEISRMANCEHLAAENMGQSKFDWAERILKQLRGIPDNQKLTNWVWRQWGFDIFLI